LLRASYDAGLAGVRLLGRGAIYVLNLVLALLVLFEEWGWQPLVALVGRLRRLTVWARFEYWIEGLPPYPALVVLGLPSLAIVPVKLLAVYLLARGDFVAAALVLGAAKVVGTAFVGRLFVLTKPAILRIGWAAALYDTIIPWRDAMFARIRATWLWRMGRVVKRRVDLLIAAVRSQLAIWRAEAAGWLRARRKAISRLR
jgi:hypothetical protein